MKNNSSCCGGNATTTSCDSAIAELPRYYPRQLITPDDLTLEQNYFRDRMRRHNRLVHGWGVVCGAMVCPVTTTASDGTTTATPWLVKVQEGYALGPCGDEIILDCARTFDLRTQGVSGITGDPCIDVPDPWCSQVFTTPTNNTFCVAIKYKQCMTRPVRVQPVGCGCDDTSCEYSRWTDGYEISTLPSCPTTSQNPPSLDNLFKGAEPGCPECPSSPWVSLAIVTVDGNGNITSIDNCSCRRLVLSFSQVWWQCGIVKIASVSDANNPIGPLPVVMTADGKTQTKLRVVGTNLDPTYTYTLGNGITVQSATATAGAQAGTSVDLLAIAATTAAAGNRTLTVVSPDCNAAIFTPAVSVSVPAIATGRVVSGQVAPVGKAVAKKVAPKPAQSADATVGTATKASPAATDKTTQPASTKSTKN
jgi:hypothetical protein